MIFVMNMAQIVCVLYEMFLGPLEQSKPWNTQGLSVFLDFEKFYNLYFDGITSQFQRKSQPKAELKVLHTLIKKFTFDIQNFSFNTSVSPVYDYCKMVAKMKCNKEQF